MSNIVPQSSGRIASNPREYPRWIDHNGTRIMVNDHYHHSAMAGVEYDKDAKLVAKEPEKPKATPPKLETVLAAGYGGDVAKAIVAKEQFKFEHGIQPYGDKDEQPFATELDAVAVKAMQGEPPPPGTPGGPADPQDLVPAAKPEKPLPKPRGAHAKVEALLTDEQELTAEILFGKK
jgi:hypothetical protein